MGHTAHAAPAVPSLRLSPCTLQALAGVPGTFSTESPPATPRLLVGHHASLIAFPRMAALCACGSRAVTHRALLSRTASWHQLCVALSTIASSGFPGWGRWSAACAAGRPEPQERPRLSPQGLSPMGSGFPKEQAPPVSSIRKVFCAADRGSPNSNFNGKD